ncbi:hypothetical protein [Pectobacterium fontis]|uniref:Uncharacterized protein n=1 Tax=Pectobacterium fontis TaxID=2558042 RepID=A0A7V8IFY0_9GAMM|nr:hypothetical protein [Pectobacterium fontis]KHN49427.1 hypothetical protein OI69_18095 [Pectobacterium fontis]
MKRFNFLTIPILFITAVTKPRKWILITGFAFSSWALTFIGGVTSDIIALIQDYGLQNMTLTEWAITLYIFLVLSALTYSYKTMLCKTVYYCRHRFGVYPFWSNLLKKPI